MSKDTNFELSHVKSLQLKNKLLDEKLATNMKKWTQDEHTKHTYKYDEDVLGANNYALGAMQRLSNISILKYGMTYSMIKGTVVVFTLHDILNHKELNYSTIFCEKLSDMPEYAKKP